MRDTFGDFIDVEEGSVYLPETDDFAYGVTVTFTVADDDGNPSEDEDDEFQMTLTRQQALQLASILTLEAFKAAVRERSSEMGGS